MNKTKKLLAIAVCALTVVLAFALAGCGGSAPKQSDEALIKADIDKVIGTEINADELTKELQGDSDIKAYEAYGLDVERASKALASKYKVEIGEVKVSGDKAVATVKVTTPTFGNEMDAMLSEKIEAIDTTGMDEQEVMKAAMNALVELFESPDYPVATASMDIDYVKQGGNWKMADSDAMDKELRSIMGLG